MHMISKLFPHNALVNSETGRSDIAGRPANLISRRESGTQLGCRLGGKLIRLDFFFDCPFRFRRNLDELDADSDTGQTVTDFTSSQYFKVRAGQLKTDSQHGAFGKMVWGIDEHSFRTDVGSAESDILSGTFINNRQTSNIPVVAHFFA